MGLKTSEILLAESYHEQVSFESGFKKRKGRRISEIGWQRVLDRKCKKAEGTLSERFGVALWDFEELLFYLVIFMLIVHSYDFFQKTRTFWGGVRPLDMTPVEQLGDDSW